MSRDIIREFVNKKGKYFEPALLPEDIKRGKIGDCFDHCLMVAVKSKGKYQYCEGEVFIPLRGWMHHAWLTNVTEKSPRGFRVAYDPTWKGERNDTGEEIPLYMAYYNGAILDTKLVAEFVMTTEYKSPLANYDRDEELAEKIFENAY